MELIKRPYVAFEKQIQTCLVLLPVPTEFIPARRL